MVLVNSPSLSERAKRFQERAIRTKTAGIKAKAKKVTKKTKKPAKTKPMNCTKTAGIKAKAKKVTTKTKKPAKTKPRNNPVVPVATKATNIMILPESLNPEDDVELLNFFEAFGVVASRKVSMVFLKPDGQKVEKKVKHHKNLRRMVAALIIHFLYYAPFRMDDKHTLPRITLCDFEAIWNPHRRQFTKAFVIKLNSRFRFLNRHEDAESFIRSFCVGGTHQYYRNKFKSPKGNPVRWFQDGHEFTEEKGYGIHVSLKPFFKLLCLPLGKNAYESEIDENDDMSDEDESKIDENAEMSDEDSGPVNKSKIDENAETPVNIENIFDDSGEE